MKRFLVSLPFLALIALAGCSSPTIEGSPSTAASASQSASAASSSPSAPRPYPSASEPSTATSEPSSPRSVPSQSSTKSSETSKSTPTGYTACGIVTTEIATGVMGVNAVFDHENDHGVDGSGCTYTDESGNALLAIALSPHEGLGADVMGILASKYEDKGCDVNYRDSRLEDTFGPGAFNMICVQNGKKLNTLWFILGPNIAQISFTDEIPAKNVGALAAYIIQNYS